MSADVSMNTDEGTAITHWVWDTAKVEYNFALMIKMPKRNKDTEEQQGK